MSEINDADLLAQLNAGLPPVAPGDQPLEQGASRETQLTVPVATRPNPVAAADAVHSTAAGGKGYRVKVRGEYYANNPDGKGKVKKPYEVVVNLPKLDAALSVIKNKMLRPAVMRQYPDFVSDRTIEIISATPLSNATARSNNLSYMDRTGLEEYARQFSVPVTLESFPPTDAGTFALRESIIDFIQNPDPVRVDEKGRNTVKPGDPGTFLFRERQRQEKREEDAALAELNPGLTVQ